MPPNEPRVSRDTRPQYSNSTLVRFAIMVSPPGIVTLLECSGRREFVNRDNRSACCIRVRLQHELPLFANGHTHKTAQ